MNEPVLVDSPEYEQAGMLLIDNLGVDSLDAIFDLMDLHLKELQPLLSELVARKQNPIDRIFYAPDFQELYAYMYPYRDGEDSIISKFLLEQTVYPLVIPPGTAFELAKHLSELTKGLELVENLHFLPEKEIFIDAVPSDEIVYINKILDEVQPLIGISSGGTPFEKFLSDLALYNDGVSNLLHFFQNAQLVSIDDIYPHDNPNSQIDDVIYGEVKRRLDARRDKFENNFADALNVAKIGWVSQHSNAIKNRTVLVTHTAALLEQNLINEYKALRIGKSNLIKSHFSAFYETVIASHNRNSVEGQIAFVREAIVRCTNVRNAVAGVLQHNVSTTNYPKRFSPAAVERFLEVNSAMTKIVLSEELQKLDSYFNQPILQEIDNYRIRNAQRNVLVREMRGDNSNFDQKNILNITQQVVQLKGLVKELLEVSLKKSGHFADLTSDVTPRNSKHFTVDLAFAKIKDELQLSSEIRHFEIATPTGSLIFALQQFADEYYSCFWSTSTSIVNFMNTVNRVFSTLFSDYVVPDMYRTDGVTDIEDSFYIEGIIVSTDKTRRPLNLSWPLEHNKLLKWVTDEEIVISIRVNTLIGDFTYEVLDVSGETMNRIGIISHFNLTNVIQEVFSETSAYYLIPTVLRFELTKKLVNYHTLQENDLWTFR